MRRAVTLIMAFACLAIHVSCRSMFLLSCFRCLTPVRPLHVLEARSGKHVIAAECGNSRR
jgi:hypothetical protein